ncbi:hypothetical protein [Pseudomonas sp. KU43P]|uniref:hypothetical protein n=1 Tax=Pseudomonas sp. KU43P TaxID=2487887 RepID=UPI0012AAB97D|nr:hypothetical protein [Pseudomonas sp. KU43P]BBH46069.1 hypothetical protein KU43P_25460 [Pseudomonas sp. KU43P]
MNTGKSVSDIDAPRPEAADGDDWPTGQDDDESEEEEEGEQVKGAQPIDPDDVVDQSALKESERGSGHPDPSRASEAERYSYQPWQKMKP